MGNSQNVGIGMKAAQYTSHSSDCADIRFVTANKPTLPSAGSVLIKVHASSINPADIVSFSLPFLPAFMLWFPFRYIVHTFIWPMIFPFTPGYEFSGVVDSVSPDVTTFKAGDEVFAMNWGSKGHQEGSYPIAGGFAEYAVMRASAVSKKPANVSHALASAHAMVCTSAFQTLNVVKAGAGSKILILGGSTAVGAMAIQLAKLRGAWVAATVSTRATEYVTQFGADVLINYDEKKWWLESETGLSGFDIIVQCAGGPGVFANAKTAGLVKPGGSFVSMSAMEAGFNPAAHKPAFSYAAFFPAVHDLAAQDEMIRLVSEGRLIVPIEETFPFTQQGIWDIFAKVKGGKSLGKNVLQIIAE